MIKALIFDFDGLILDTESPEFQAWQEVFAAHGHELRADLWADLIGRPRTYFDMYAYFKELNGPRTDLDALRKDRRARVVQLVLEQPILPGVRDYLSERAGNGLEDRPWHRAPAAITFAGISGGSSYSTIFT